MSAPLVVNTKDGTCWTRRTVTSGGLALYAPESVKTCPEFVMATEAELAEHGIVGSAFALPMPVAPEPQEDPVAAGRRLDLLALMDERAASAVSPVLAGVLDEAERLRASRWDATKVVAQMESKLLAMHGELTRATERVAELEAERHSTNESLSEAAETLRANRDRITQLEARLAEREQPTGTYPPALPWAALMDADDLEGFLADLVDAASGDDDLSTLTEVESTIARWRVIAEAQHAHNTAPGPDATTDEPGMRPAVRTIGGDA
jgi:uncharacterized protein YoaH (UPF0181 family)